MKNLLKVRKGDNVLVTSGKDRGKKGKVVRIFPRIGKLIVEGVNERIRHTRPRKSGEKGQRIHVLHPLQASNVMVVCHSCGKGTRVGFLKNESGKTRICKKCGANLS
jgi:large subunit ribosomal protein L24